MHARWNLPDLKAAILGAACAQLLAHHLHRGPCERILAAGVQHLAGEVATGILPLTGQDQTRHHQADGECQADHPFPLPWTSDGRPQPPILLPLTASSP
jgi:hypothetical protein